MQHDSDCHVQSTLDMKTPNTGTLLLQKEHNWDMMTSTLLSVYAIQCKHDEFGEQCSQCSQVMKRDTVPNELPFDTNRSEQHGRWDTSNLACHVV